MSHHSNCISFLQLDEAIASITVFVIGSGLDERAETILEPANITQNGKKLTLGFNGELEEPMGGLLYGPIPDRHVSRNPRPEDRKVTL